MEADATEVAPSRRARLRRELTQAIKDCAWNQIAEHGVASVTLRGIARELGVSPAALYGYFDSLDALFTALITDGYESLAQTVASASDAVPNTQPGPRLLASIHAYRDWALACPDRFRLLYFSPDAAYDGPDQGPTLTAALRVVVPMLTTFVDAWERGDIPQPPPGPPLDASKFVERFGLDITSDQLRMATECWAEFHGLVALEINRHISEKWVDPAALFDANVRSTLARMGFATD